MEFYLLQDFETAGEGCTIDDSFVEMDIPDHRNDDRILAVFRRDGKLVE